MKNTIRRTITRRAVIVASVLALGALTTIMALAFTDRANMARADVPNTIPPMTLTYEVYGPSIGVGTRSIERFKEIRRLEYRGENDWTETVITSPTVDLGRYGTGSNVGSYTTVKGNTETYHDAMVGTTDTTALDADTIHLPFGLFGHAHVPPGFSHIGTGAGVSVALDAAISVDGISVPNARGIKYTEGNRELVMYEGAGFTIPVKSGDTFVLKSADIRP